MALSSGSDNRAELAAQQRLGAVKPYSSSAFVTVQNRGYLGERSITRIAQGDDLCVLRRQLGNGLREHALQVGSLGECVRQRLVIDGFVAGLTVNGVVGHDERDGAASTDYVDAAIARDSK